MLILAIVGGLVVFRVRERQRRENVQIMFDLPTGVLHEDPDGFIVDANDRAEEVLNEKLPRSGFDLSRAKPREFERLFKRFVSDQFQELEYKEDIAPLRKTGGTSTYYALIDDGSNGDKWVRVTGSPLLRADGKTEHFGAIEPASQAALAELGKLSTGEKSS
jgi:PAS domain-containing protein